MADLMPRATTLSDHAHRLVQFIRQSAAAAQGQGEPPDIALLSADLTGTSGAVKAVTTAGTHPRTGLPCALVQLADTRKGPLKGNPRRPRHLTPAAASALLLVLLHVGEAEAPAGLTRHPLTAWLVMEGVAGTLGRAQALAMALAALPYHEVSELTGMTSAEHRTLLSAAFDLAELSWCDAGGRGHHASEAA